jgi:para-aminobenzoate synthetase component 1
VSSFNRFAQRAAEPHVAFLDTAAGKGTSWLASRPCKIFRAKSNRCEILTENGTTRFQQNPFDALAAILADEKSATAIGYFGYELKNFIERLPQTAADDLGLPDCWFGFYDEVETFAGENALAAPISRAETDIEIASNFTRDEYVRAIQRAKEYIAAGDVYQVNLSQRFRCAFDDSPISLYETLRRVSPAPFSAYLDIGNAQILSSSPELFLEIHDRHIKTRPIKGTRRRGNSPEEDKKLRDELQNSAKDRAELLMITDLERNDLGKVCQFGSVFVPELVTLEEFANVFHLVATVEGLLRRDVSHLDALRACFPGGSVTGAPKIRAMQIIDELEPHARGVYTGAIGYFSPARNEAKFNIAIRTVMHTNKELYFHAGGGIVADSDPDAEYDETLAKAKGILNAIEQCCLRQRRVPARS